MHRWMRWAVLGLSLLALAALPAEPASALTCESTTGSDRWFSPYSAYLGLYYRNSSGKIDRIDMGSMEWTATAIGEYDLKDTWEGEWRHSNIKSIFDSVVTVWSELPNPDWEFDSDDFTFVSRDPQKMTPGYPYDAYARFAPDPAQPSSFTLGVESEYGWDGLVDSLPRDCDWLANVPSGHYISW